MCRVSVLTDPGGYPPGSPSLGTTRRLRSPKPVRRIFRTNHPPWWEVGPKGALVLHGSGGVWAQDPLLGGTRERGFGETLGRGTATPSPTRGSREPLAGGTPVVASHWSEYRAPVAAGRLVCVAIVCVTLPSLSPLATLAKHRTERIKLQIQTEQSQKKKAGQYKHQSADSDL